MKFTETPTVTVLGPPRPGGPNREEAFKDAASDVRHFISKLERRANAIAARLLKTARNEGRDPGSIDVQAIAKAALDEALADMAARQ